MKAYNENIKALGSSVHQKRLEYISNFKKSNKKLYDFSAGDPKDPTPEIILKKLKESLTPLNPYPPYAGLKDLKSACSKWLKRSLNVDYPEAMILSSNGSKEAIYHASQVFINPKERSHVLIPVPAYPTYLSGCLLANGKPLTIPLSPSDNYEFNIKSLNNSDCKNAQLLWLNYPHNPTGALLSKNRMEEIYSWALENDILIFSDECYIDNVDPQSEKQTSFLRISQNDNFKNVLCFFSLSKRSGATGLRSGFIAGDEALISIFSKARSHQGIGTPIFIQKSATEAWSHDEHVFLRNKNFQKKRLLLENFFDKKGLKYFQSGSGINLWIETPNGFKTQEFCQALLDKTGILVTPGETFHESSKNYFRMTLAPLLEEIEEAMLILDKSYEEIKNDFEK